MQREKKTTTHLIIFFIFCIFIVIGSYTFNFKNNSISTTSSDWGSFGDYLGGVLNPLISLIALSFLIKTYLSQKHELHQSKIAVEEQRKISQTTAYIQLTNAKISASYEKIAIYRGEKDAVTHAMNAPGNGLSYTGLDGVIYFNNDDQKRYRISMTNKIQTELENIKKLLDDLNEFRNSLREAA